MRIVLLIVFVLVWAAPAAGQGQVSVDLPASPPTPASFDVWAFGVKAALRTWGANPPCGVPVFQRLGDDELAALAGGLPDAGTTFMVAEPDACRISYGADAFRAEPDSLCATIVHEYGHLWGLGHSSSAMSPMYEGELTGDQVPACGRCIYERETKIRNWRERRGHRVRVTWIKLRAELHPGC
jgi:hypothetical protein